MTGAGDICSNGVYTVGGFHRQGEQRMLTLLLGPLHLAFFAVKALVLRVIMSPATTLAKSNSCSNLNRYFQSSLEEFKPFVTLVTSIKPADLNAFWGRSESSFIIPLSLTVRTRFEANPRNRCKDASCPLRKFLDISLSLCVYGRAGAGVVFAFRSIPPRASILGYHDG